MWNPFKRKPESLPKIKDTWDLAQTVSDGRPMFLRVNTGLRAVMGKPPSSHRVGVTFVLRAPNEHGLPDAAESETLNQFEDALLPALGVPGPTYLAVVITTNGSYWNWYGFPLEYTLAQAFTQWIGFVVAGFMIAVIYGWWRRKPVTLA